MSRIFPPLALSGALAALLFAFASAGDRVRVEAGPQSADIAVEHGAPLRLSVTVSEGAAPAVAELSHDGAETAGLSVPALWTLREVRGKALSDVPADPPALGYVRWSVPPGAVLSFTLPSPPLSLTLHNPSRVQMQVKLMRINVKNASVENEVFLLQDDTLRLY